ncbi:hypothetical protein NIES2101_09200 [Calothrix sp. HK-06]|nr:hypothetical protein NIES2101_09200 [Calothrix sp. HK-06]
MNDKNILPITHLHIFYFGTHLLALSVFWSEFNWFLVSLCLISYFVRQFGVVAGYHRYFSHRSFKTSRWMQFLLALYGCLCGQRGPLWWAQTHRLHHRYSDTPDDLHSPRYQGLIYSHSGWFFNKRFAKTYYDQIPDFAKFPELVWLDQRFILPWLVFGASMFFFFGWEGFLWGFCVSNVMIWHTTHLIQSACHCPNGYRRFETTDDSRNLWAFGLVSLGEGFHNNHHYDPSSARHGFVWWEIDIAWYILKCLNWLGLVWDLKTPKKWEKQRSLNLGELDK